MAEDSPQEPKKKKKRKKRLGFRQHAKRRKPGQAHTIPSFCQNNCISESFYYKLKREGKNPDEVELDGRILIFPEAEDRWRRQREAESTGEASRARSDRARAQHRERAEREHADRFTPVSTSTAAAE